MEDGVNKKILHLSREGVVFYIILMTGGGGT